MPEIITEQVSPTADFEQNETLIFNNFTLGEYLPADEPNYNDLGCDRCDKSSFQPPEVNETSDPGIETIARFPSPPKSERMPLFQVKSTGKPLSFFPLPNARIPQSRPLEKVIKMPAITGNGGGGDHHQVTKRRRKTTTATTRKRLRKRKTSTSTTTSTTSKKKVKRTTMSSKLVT